MSRREALERRLGHRFGSGALLEQALTHRSAGARHNERLEFLGDGVLGCVIAEELYRRFPALPEGKLTRMRAGLVREETLAEVAANIDLAPLLRHDARVLQNGSAVQSILADAVEALVGAAFVDGGYAAARTVVLACFEPLLAALDPEQIQKDAKTRLQELLQSRDQPLPKYAIVATTGKDHRRTFEVECLLEPRGLATRGRGSSRQRAEQQAAEAMLDLLQ